MLEGILTICDGSTPGGPLGCAGIWAVLGLWGLAIGGLVWCPVAALICGAVAGVRGMTNPVRYAPVGAVSSIMLFLPWIYLLLSMFDVKVPRAAVVMAYVALYLALLGLTAFYISFAYDATVPFLSSEEMQLSKAPLSAHITGAIITWG